MALITIPIVTWVLCGALKFVINLTRFSDSAFNRVGHGGFPSNHTAIVSSVMWTWVLSRQWNIAALAVAVLMIYIFDATGLRREIGRHAVEINKISGGQLREIVGHTSLDIVGGLLLGLLVAVSYRSIGIVP